MKNTICLCNEVSLSEIKSVIRKKVSVSLSDIQLATAAGKRCGRCMPQLEAILEDELKKREAVQLKLF